MIYDKITNISRYLGMNTNLDTAIHYLMEHDLNALPLGRTEVDGNHVFINVMEAEAGDLEEKSYEIHKNYMDIQIDLIGTEAIQIGNEADMKVPSFDEEKDFGFATASPLVMCTMGPGNFLVCMTSEPHMPGIKTGTDCHLKKAVVKVSHFVY